MDTALLCLENGCKYSRKEHKDSDTIRCIICMKWFHVACVQESHPAALHTCSSCRTLASNVSNISEGMQSVMDTLGKLTRDISQMKTNQETLQTENETTKQDNALLRKEILSLRAELQRVQWPLQPSDSIDKPSLIVGSSVLRDVDNEKLANAYVHSISGGKIEDVVKYLTDIPTGKYNNVTLLVAGNDCDEDSSIVDIVQKYTDLIDLTKSKFGETIVASVLPRHDPNTTTIAERIDSLNAELQVICTEKGCKYTNNNCAFKMQDGKINDGFYLTERLSGKLVHLNDRGTTKLCELLSIKPKTNKVTKDRQRNMPPQRRYDSKDTTPRNVPPSWPRDAPQVARDNAIPRAPPPRPPATQQPSTWDRQPPPQHAPHPGTQQHTPAATAPAEHTPPRATGPAPPLTRLTDDDTSYARQPDRQYSYQQADYYGGTTSDHYSTYNPYNSGYRQPQQDNTTYDYERQTRYNDMQCYYCGERHDSSRCWFNIRVVCTYCKAEGHKAKNCPYAREHSNQSTQVTHATNYY